MRRRGFLARLLAAPAALAGLAVPIRRHFCDWLGLSRASYPVLKSNIYAAPGRNFSEPLLREAFDRWWPDTRPSWTAKDAAGDYIRMPLKERGRWPV